LNGSGKTTWAKKYIEENPKKDFNLLNIEYVLSKMTVRLRERERKKIVLTIKIICFS